MQLTAIEGSSDDDINIYPGNFTGTTVRIHEGDNGGSGGFPHDSPFMVVWYGECTRVTNVVVS